MERIVVSTKEAPAAIGPYEQAIRIGQFIFTSGQIPIDPSTGKIMAVDIEGQTHQVLKNLKAVLRAEGADFDDVVKTTVFITDMSSFPTINAVYASYFTGNKPARSTVAVAALPLGSLIEIEAVATARK